MLRKRTLKSNQYRGESERKRKGIDGWKGRPGNSPPSPPPPHFLPHALFLYPLFFTFFPIFYLVFFAPNFLRRIFTFTLVLFPWGDTLLFVCHFFLLFYAIVFARDYFLRDLYSRSSFFLCKSNPFFVLEFLLSLSLTRWGYFSSPFFVEKILLSFSLIICTFFFSPLDNFLLTNFTFPLSILKAFFLYVIPAWWAWWIFEHLGGRGDRFSYQNNPLWHSIIEVISQAFPHHSVSISLHYSR